MFDLVFISFSAFSLSLSLHWICNSFRVDCRSNSIDKILKKIIHFQEKVKKKTERKKINFTWLRINVDCIMRSTVQRRIFVQLFALLVKQLMIKTNDKIYFVTIYWNCVVLNNCFHNHEHWTTHTHTQLIIRFRLHRDEIRRKKE